MPIALIARVALRQAEGEQSRRTRMNHYPEVIDKLKRMASSGGFSLTCLSVAYPADHLPELSRFSRCTGFVERVDRRATSRGKAKILCLHLPPELVHHE